MDLRSDNLFIVSAGQKAHSRNFTGSHSWIISPKWINDLTLSTT